MGFILSVTIVSLLNFNNTDLGGPTVRVPSGPAELQARPSPACFPLSKFKIQNLGQARAQTVHWSFLNTINK